MLMGFVESVERFGEERRRLLFGKANDRGEGIYKFYAELELLLSCEDVGRSDCFLKEGVCFSAASLFVSIFSA